jgi:hypothetical protein
MHSGHWEAELAADSLDRGQADRRHEVQQNAYPAEGHQTALHEQRHVHLPPGIPKDIVGKPRWRTPVHNLTVHGLRRVPAHPDLPVIHALIVSRTASGFRRCWEIAMDPLSSTRQRLAFPGCACRKPHPHHATRRYSLISHRRTRVYVCGTGRGRQVAAAVSEGRPRTGSGAAGADCDGSRTGAGSAADDPGSRRGHGPRTHGGIPRSSVQRPRSSEASGRCSARSGCRRPGVIAPEVAYVRATISIGIRNGQSRGIRLVCQALCPGLRRG